MKQLLQMNQNSKDQAQYQIHVGSIDNDFMDRNSPVSQFTPKVIGGQLEFSPDRKKLVKVKKGVKFAAELQNVISSRDGSQSLSPHQAEMALLEQQSAPNRNNIISSSPSPSSSLTGGITFERNLEIKKKPNLEKFKSFDNSRTNGPRISLQVTTDSIPLKKDLTTVSSDEDKSLKDDKPHQVGEGGKFIVGKDYFQKFNILVQDFLPPSMKQNLEPGALRMRKPTNPREIVQNFMLNQRNAVERRNMIIKKQLDEFKSGVRQKDLETDMKDFYGIQSKTARKPALKSMTKEYGPPKLSETFGDALPRSKSVSEDSEHPPDMAGYEFFNVNNSWQKERYMNDLLNWENKNKKRNDKDETIPAKTLMMQLIYSHLVKQLDEFSTGELPVKFQKNKLKWCSLLMRSQDLQKFHEEFSDRLTGLIRGEMTHQKELYKVYLRQKLDNPKSLASGTNFQKDFRLEELEKMDASGELDLYFKSANYKKIQEHDKRVDKELVEAKFNYRMLQREQRRKRMQMTGQNKHMRSKTTQAQGQKKFLGSMPDKVKERKKLKRTDSHDSFLDEIIQQKKIKANIANLTDEELEKLKRTKYAKYLMSEFQLQVQEAAKNLDDLVKDAEENNQDLRIDIQNVETELNTLDEEKQRINKVAGNFVPGRKIQRMLNDWSQADMIYDEDIKRMATELWLTLKEYEKMIDDEGKGYKMEYEKLKKQYEGHIQYIKEVSSEKIIALESALIETKLKLRRDNDRLAMTISDIESRALNKGSTAKPVNQLLKDFETGFKLNNVKEARVKLEEFASALKAKEEELDQSRTILEMQNKQLETFEERIKDRDAYFYEERRLRQYYQRLMMKLIRDLNIFKKETVSGKRFSMLNENDNDMNYQRQMQWFLEHLDIQTILIKFANSFHGHIDNLQIVGEIADQMGLMSDVREESEDEVQLPSPEPLYEPERDKPKPVEQLEPQQQKSASPTKKSQNKGKLKRTATKMSSKIDVKPESQLTMNSPSPRLEEFMPSKASIKKKNSIGGKEVSKALILQFKNSLQKSLAGQIDELKATMETGLISGEPQSTRKQMHEFITAISPDNLEDFRVTHARKEEEMEVKMKTLEQQVNHWEQKAKEAIKKASDNKLKQHKEDGTPAIKKQQTSIKQKLGKFAQNALTNKNPLKTQTTPKRDATNTRSEKFSDSPPHVKSDDSDSLSRQDQYDNSLKSQNTNKLKKQQTIVKREASYKKKATIANNKRKLQKQATQDQSQNIAQSEDGSIKATSNMNVTQTGKQSSNDDKSIIEDEEEELISPEVQNDDLNDTKKMPSIDLIEENPEGEVSDSVSQTPHGSVVTNTLAQDQYANSTRASIKGLKKNASPNLSSGKVKDSSMKDSRKPELNKGSIGSLADTQKSQILQSKSNKTSTHEDLNNRTLYLEGEEQPVGVGIIWRELQAMHEKKYEQIIAEAEDEIEEYQESKEFKMNAKQITFMQEFVQKVMNRKLPYDVLMERLFKGDIGEFFTNLNEIIVENYNLEKPIDVEQNLGIDLEYQEKYNNADKKSRKRMKMKEQEKHKKVSVGNIIRPHFSQDGELAGFDMKAELIPMMFLNNDFNMAKLRRTIRACCFMNRILHGDKDVDFVLKQMVDGEEQEEDVAVKVCEVDIQVDEESLRQNAISPVNSSEEESQEETIETPRSSMVTMLRDHLITILSQNDNNKKAYYKMILGSFDIEKLFNYQIEGMYLSASEQQRRIQPTFERYMTKLLQTCAKQIGSMGPLRNITVDSIFSSQGQSSAQTSPMSKLGGALRSGFGMGQSPVAQKLQASIAVQVAPVTLDTGSYTGQELTTTFVTKDGKVKNKRATNQLVLDQAMQEEFKRTLEIFDEFASQIAFVEQAQVRKRVNQDIQSVRNPNSSLPSMVTSPVAVNQSDTYRIEVSTPQNESVLPSAQLSPAFVLTEKMKKKFNLPPDFDANDVSEWPTIDKKPSPTNRTRYTEDHEYVPEQYQDIRHVANMIQQSTEKIRDQGPFKKVLDNIAKKQKTIKQKMEGYKRYHANDILENVEKGLFLSGQSSFDTGDIQIEKTNSDSEELYKIPRKLTASLNSQFHTAQMARTIQSTRSSFDVDPSIQQLVTPEQAVQVGKAEMVAVSRDINIQLELHKKFNDSLRDRLTHIVSRNKHQAENIEKILAQTSRSGQAMFGKGYSSHFGSSKKSGFQKRPGQKTRQTAVTASTQGDPGTFREKFSLKISDAGLNDNITRDFLTGESINTARDRDRDNHMQTKQETPLRHRFSNMDIDNEGHKTDVEDKIKLQGDKIQILTVPDIIVQNEQDSTGTGPTTAGQPKRKVVKHDTLKMPTISTAEQKRRFISEEERLFPETSFSPRRQTAARVHLNKTTQDLIPKSIVTKALFRKNDINTKKPKLKEAFEKLGFSTKPSVVGRSIDFHTLKQNSMQNPAYSSLIGPPNEDLFAGKDKNTLDSIVLPVATATPSSFTMGKDSITPPPINVVKHQSNINVDLMALHKEKAKQKQDQYKQNKQKKKIWNDPNQKQNSFRQFKDFQDQRLQEQIKKSASLKHTPNGIHESIPAIETDRLTVENKPGENSGSLMTKGQSPMTLFHDSTEKRFEKEFGTNESPRLKRPFAK